MLKVSRLEEIVLEWTERERNRDTDEDDGRRDQVEKIRAAQGLLAIIQQRAAVPKRLRWFSVRKPTSSTGALVAQPTKRRRGD